MFKNCIDDLLRLIDQRDQVKIGSINHAILNQLASQPIHEAAPERRPDQNHRDRARFAGLDKSQNLAQLIQGTEPAR